MTRQPVSECVRIIGFILVFIVCIHLTPAQQKSRALTLKECSSILSNLAGIPPLIIGSTEVRLSSRENLERIVDLGSQMRRLPASGVVLYVVVQADESVSLIRFESQGIGNDVKEDFFRSADLDHDNFLRAVKGARKSGNVHYRNELATAFEGNGQLGKDAGKPVFVLDAGGFGLVPLDLGMSDAVILGSISLETALQNRRRLETPNPPTQNIAGLFGIPRTSEDYVRIFGKPSGQSQYAPLDQWQMHGEEQQKLVDTFGLKLLNEKGGSKWKMLEEQDGIIMIIAHADGVSIRFSDNELIKLSPSDISKLNLKKNPVVFLRVCQGEDIGFADAFIHAGASAVWTNRGPIAADVANHEAQQFLGLIKSGKSVKDAINQIRNNSEAANHRTALFTTVIKEAVERPPNKKG